MRNEQLKRTLKVMRRTGDKAIVMDVDTDEVFVLMNLDNYEDLLDETEMPPFPPLPSNGHGDGNSDVDGIDDFLSDHLDQSEAEAEPESEEINEIFPFESTARKPVNPAKTLDFSEDFVPVAAKNNSTEESLADVPNDEEEEKFYLEPVE